MKSYRDLQIYVDAKKLAIEVHKITLQLPKFELYEEWSQLRRSSKSIAAMIVEGYGRKRYKADFIKYLVYAIAECDETYLHIEFIYETGSLKDKQTFLHLTSEYDLLSKRINRFIQWVENNWNDFPKNTNEH